MLKKGINILSLFDGMSCGQLALDRLGVKVNNYFASEIDKYAIKVTQSNYPKTIHLGDVRNVSWVGLPKIDLMTAGSPCQGFSFAGKQLNFEDPRSKLFFEFVRLIDETKPKYFLLENVKMKKEYQDVISGYLGVEPIEINSSLVSAQNRKRLYWTNIPNVTQPEDKGIVLKDIIEDSKGESNDIYRKYNKSNKPKKIGEIKGGGQGNRIYSEEGKSISLSAQSGGTAGNGNMLLGVNNSEKSIAFRKLTPIECERLQTVPDNYTKSVSNNQRHKMLGNGWTVDVIAHILKNME